MKKPRRKQNRVVHNFTIKAKVMAGGYGEDLAYIHDVGFGHFAKNATPGLLEMVRQTGLKDGLVVDLGCGSGIWARALCDVGYEVLGVDQSAAMISIARKRVPEGRFRRESFLTAKLPRCIAVTAIGEGFNYIFDRRNTERRLAALFHRIYDALLPRGVFIFDVAGPGRVVGPGIQRKYSEGDDWATLVAIEEDRQRKLLTRRITSFRKVGDLYRRHEEVHQQRLFTRTEVAEQLRGCGFRVRGLRGYGAMRFAPGAFGFLARKP
jgi:SAM-dependent methyltransferase